MSRNIIIGISAVVVVAIIIFFSTRKKRLLKELNKITGDEGNEDSLKRLMEKDPSIDAIKAAISLAKASTLIKESAAIYLDKTMSLTK